MRHVNRRKRRTILADTGSKHVKSGGANVAAMIQPPSPTQLQAQWHYLQFPQLSTNIPFNMKPPYPPSDM